MPLNKILWTETLKFFAFLQKNVSMKFSNKFISGIGVYFVEDSITKKLRVVRERSSNGEIHLIFQDSAFDKCRKNAIDLDEAEIRIIM